MLDPRYKDSVFSHSDRMNAFNLVIHQMQKIREEEQPLVSVKKESPPSKRFKQNDIMDLMETGLNAIDERDQTFEDSDLEAIEKVR